jgi:Cu/Ag efflux pump CusA
MGPADSRGDRVVAKPFESAASGASRLGDAQARAVTVSIDEAKCAALGVSPSDAKLAADIAFHDVRAGRLLVGWREVSSANPTTYASLLLAGSSPTPLATVAVLREVAQPWSILRRDGKREVTVHVSISGRDLTDFERDADRAIASTELPSDCAAQWAD